MNIGGLVDALVPVFFVLALRLMAIFGTQLRWRKNTNQEDSNCREMAKRIWEVSGGGCDCCEHKVRIHRAGSD